MPSTDTDEGSWLFIWRKKVGPRSLMNSIQYHRANVHANVSHQVCTTKCEYRRLWFHRTYLHLIIGLGCVVKVELIRSREKFHAQPIISCASQMPISVHLKNLLITPTNIEQNFSPHEMNKRYICFYGITLPTGEPSSIPIANGGL